MAEPYILTRRKGMKNLRLRISPDGGIYVSAPYGVSRASIDEFVESRADWINKRRSELTSENTGIVDGGYLTVLGRRLEIRVTEGENSCREENGVLYISAAEPENTAKLEELALSYMAERCREVLEDAFSCYLTASGYVGRRPVLRLRLLKSRWGSCDRTENVITLNLMLCKLPEKFSRYVAAHEVIHLFIPNHSAAFYELGEKLFPDFRKTDRELNKVKVCSLLS